MPASRLADCFRSLRAARKGAVLPYLTAGFPDNATVAELIRRADRIGVPVIEIGFPYSDSIADGPVIQNSFHEVLSRGHTLEDSFHLVADVRPAVECALVAMVSYSIVLRSGLAAFMDRAAAVGFDGVILPDLPLEESQPARLAAERAGLCHVGLVAPTTSAKRCEAIASCSSGFIYQIAVAGTTGERVELPGSLAADVARLRSVSDLPVCVGFGISSPEQVRMVCDVCDGAIVGSAIVRRLSAALDGELERAATIESVLEFLCRLMSAAAQANG